MTVRATFRAMRELSVALKDRPSLLLLPLLSVVLLIAGFLGGWSGWQSDIDRIAWLAPGDSLAVDIALSIVLTLVSAVVATFVSTAFGRGLLATETLGSALAATRDRLPVIAQFAGLTLALSLAGFLLEERVDTLGSIAQTLLSFAVTAALFYMTPVVAMEGRGFRQSAARSVDLVKRSLGTIVLSGLMLGAAVSVVAALVACVLLAALGSVPSRDDGFSSGEIAVGAAAAPFILAALLTLELWTLALYRQLTTQPVRGAQAPRRAAAKASRRQH